MRVLGSVAASVAEGARCPVMILPASPATQAPICTLIERVLVPIHDIEIAPALIETVLAELGQERARGIEFHLVEVTTPDPPQPATVDGERFADADEVPTHFLRRLAAGLHERGYRATWHLRIGEPSRAVG